MPDITVSEATSDDAATIGSFLRAAWREAGPNAPGFTGATDELIEEITAPDAVRARVGGPERRMFVARSGPDIVAIAGTRRIDGVTVELAGIIVLQSLVGGGIGTPLLEAVAAAAADDGATELMVRTERDNERALGFYRRRGFSERGAATEDVDGEPVEVTELVRILGGERDRR